MEIESDLIYFDHLVIVLEKNPDVIATAYGLIKQVAWVGGGAAVGATVGGPFGAAIGGLVGLACSYACRDDYQSLIISMKRSGYTQKIKVVKEVQGLMLKKREEKLFERLVIGQGSQLISYTNQRLKGLKFADCLVYRKVTFRLVKCQELS
ncbi:hypothetical protein PoB_000221100 [Plakobranchus ocellatus]|uniref:Glycine zipper domain-containing protein n=1 Tax=Plakobranchus ocellatus TaxID=259542 RepID=A0AAV3XXY3_9GAST|nr:hypothetical protein PoB_000221100 [Plakobranchus ocellatus]